MKKRKFYKIEEFIQKFIEYIKPERRDSIYLQYEGDPPLSEDDECVEIYTVVHKFYKNGYRINIFEYYNGYSMLGPRLDNQIFVFKTKGNHLVSIHDIGSINNLIRG